MEQLIYHIYMAITTRCRHMINFNDEAWEYLVL